jgi:hypothetical protein
LKGKIPGKNICEYSVTIHHLPVFIDCHAVSNEKSKHQQAVDFVDRRNLFSMQHFAPPSCKDHEQEAAKDGNERV